MNSMDKYIASVYRRQGIGSALLIAGLAVLAIIRALI